MIKLSLQLLFNNSVKYSDVNSQTTMAQIPPILFLEIKPETLFIPFSALGPRMRVRSFL